MLSRRTLLSSSTAAGGALLLGTSPAASSLDLQAAERVLRHGPRVGSFVSTPDLFNGDVGDLRSLDSWDGGPNSINASWEAAIDKCLGAVARHRPDAVLVAGDLVEGRWNIDTDDRRLFGRVSQLSDPVSLAACRRAITLAGGVYYGHHRQAFARRGLRLLPALGDHEILDDRIAPTLNDRWTPHGVLLSGADRGEPDNRYHLVPHAKRTWADHFTTTGDGRPRFARRPRGTAAERTAYAVDLGPRLTIVTVDVFTHTPRGVRLGVFDGQLAWLRRTVRAAKRRGRVVVVQGHVPVLAPFRSLSSGGLRLPEGKEATLWRVLAQEGVDLYLCGEVHDTTARQPRRVGPVQVCHGSIFRYAFNYLHGTVHADGTTVLDYYEMTVERTSKARDVWSSDATKRQATRLEYGDPVHRGSMVLAGGRVRSRSGKLAPYAPRTDALGYAGNLEPERV